MRRHEGRVEAPEVDELARGVDLGLVRRLGLAEHRGRVERHPPRAGEQLGCTQEDGGALLPGSARPVVPGVPGGLDRLLDLVWAALVHVGEDVARAVGHHNLGGLAGADLLAADHERQVDALGFELVELRLQLAALGRAGRVLVDGLVHRLGQAEDAGRAHGAIVDWSVSLSEDLRNELAAITPKRECDVLAELSGLAHTAGTVHLLGGRRVAVHFDLASSAVARRGFSLLRRFEIESEIRTYTQRAFAQATRYQLHVPGAGSRAPGSVRGGDPLGAACSARAATRPRRRARLLPRCLPARRASRRRVAERSAQPAPRDPVRGGGGRSFPGRHGRARGRRAVADRPRAVRRRVRQGSGRDRRSACTCGGE